jgi:hypothetical protein
MQRCIMKSRQTILDLVAVWGAIGYHEWGADFEDDRDTGTWIIACPMFSLSSQSADRPNGGRLI